MQLHHTEILFTVWQLFAKLPRECVKKILEEHECENDEKDLADLAAESVEKSNAIYETLAEYMKTYAGQDADMLNAAMTKTVRLIKVLESCEAADVGIASCGDSR